MSLTPQVTRKPKTHHKKRVGDHHRKSKHYMKAYYPYLPMLLIVAVGLVINSLWAGHGVLGASSDFSSDSLLSATNQQREQDHENPLTINAQLTNAAQAKANDMATRNYWSHNTPDGKTPWSFITAAGYAYERVGENLAYGFSDASDTTTGWMNSAEHRANILDANYQEVGFGIATSPNYQGKGPETIVVAMYGEPVPAAANISFTVPNAQPQAGAVKAASTVEPSTRLVSRVQLLTGGQAPWSIFAVSTLMASALLLFVLRHGLMLRRLVLEGEHFLNRHPLFDAILVLTIMTTFILSRASGLIR